MGKCNFHLKCHKGYYKPKTIPLIVSIPLGTITSLSVLISASVFSTKDLLKRADFTDSISDGYVCSESEQDITFSKIQLFNYSPKPFIT